VQSCHENRIFEKRKNPLNPLLPFFAAQGFGETEAEAIAGAFALKTLEKGSFFVEEGKTSRYLGFVEKGFFQYFLIADGEEKTTYTVGANAFVASLSSFLRQRPAQEYIRAVADSVLWVIDREGLENLQYRIPRFKDFYIGLLEEQICCIDESRLDAIVLGAQQRYEKMMQKEPEILRQIPLHYLASILGVTPRHLSRIRKNIR